ncbi:hypothetical protein EAO75_44140 [Streptomyces sp. uw30]|uniref:alpha/beta hydrolase n=1 Tax=Streptomyces sp. uw30 TaxID=1828179 RepID=UPI0011CDE2BC|nr:alpha/beta hydrolase [Streptomyces sp. uw30]TXS35540.1 hypothetical protein EAO75_44140 [Streptomyces sp. uw30]
MSPPWRVTAGARQRPRTRLPRTRRTNWGGKTAVELTHTSQDHGTNGHGTCVTPAADHHLLNGKIPMEGAGCS